MIFIALAAAVLAVSFFCKKLFYDRADSDILYSVSTDTKEIFEGEDFYLFEKIENRRKTPLTNIRIDTQLPEGIDFCLYKKDESGNISAASEHTAQTVLMLPPKNQIKRRLRVTAKKRGVYALGEALLILTDILGEDKISSHFEPEKSVITVLPRAIELEKYFAKASDATGEEKSENPLICDPISFIGVRDYMPGDPISRINWKASARMQSLTVNIEEYTERISFDVILNVASRVRESSGEEPENKDAVELAITTAASVFDMACQNELPVRLITNAVNGQTNAEPFISEYMCGREDTIFALRMLASLKLKLSLRFDDMLCSISDSLKTDSTIRSAVIITSYIDNALVNYALEMKKRGEQATIFVTSSQNSISDIPGELNVYYKTYR